MSAGPKTNLDEQSGALCSGFSPDSTDNVDTSLVIDESGSPASHHEVGEDPILNPEFQVVSSTSATWNLDHVEQLDTNIGIEDRNLFNIMSDEDLTHLDTVFTNEEAEQILDQSGPLLLTAPGPSLSFDLFDQSHILPGQGDSYSLNDTSGNLEIIEEEEPTIGTPPRSDHAYALTPEKKKPSLEKEDAATEEGEEEKPAATKKRGKKSKADFVSPVRRSTRISDYEQREMAEKIRQENQQKEREAVAAMKAQQDPAAPSTEVTKQYPQRQRRQRKQYGDFIYTGVQRKGRKTAVAKEAESEASEAGSEVKEMTSDAESIATQSSESPVKNTARKAKGRTQQLKGEDKSMTTDGSEESSVEDIFNQPGGRKKKGKGAKEKEEEEKEEVDDVSVDQEGEPQVSDKDEDSSDDEDIPLSQIKVEEEKSKPKGRKKNTKKNVNDVVEGAKKMRKTPARKTNKTFDAQTEQDDSDAEAEEDDSEDGGEASDDVADDSNDDEWSDPDKLYCLCKKPYNNRFMIHCDRCNEWFHGSCVGVTRREGTLMTRNNESYICPGCLDNTDETPIQTEEKQAIDEDDGSNSEEVKGHLENEPEDQSESVTPIKVKEEKDDDAREKIQSGSEADDVGVEKEEKDEPTPARSKQGHGQTEQVSEGHERSERLKDKDIKTELLREKLKAMHLKKERKHSKKKKVPTATLR